MSASDLARAVEASGKVPTVIESREKLGSRESSSRCSRSSRREVSLRFTLGREFLTRSAEEVFEVVLKEEEEEEEESWRDDERPRTFFSFSFLLVGRDDMLAVLAVWWLAVGGGGVIKGGDREIE